MFVQSNIRCGECLAAFRSWPCKMECPPTLTPRIAHGTRRRMAHDVTVGGVRLGPRPVVVAAGGEAGLDAPAAAPGAGILELRADPLAPPAAPRGPAAAAP